MAQPLPRHQLSSKVDSISGNRGRYCLPVSTEKNRKLGSSLYLDASNRPLLMDTGARQ